MNTKLPENSLILLEGGSLRGLYTAGALDILMEHDLYFPAVAGVSAGALNAYNYVAHQPGRAASINLRYRHDRRYFGPLAAVKGGSLFGLNFLLNDIEKEVPFDEDMFKNGGQRMFAVATCVETGKAVYFEKDQPGLDFKQAVKASASLPLASVPVKIDGHSYLDGGCACPVAYQRGLDLGYGKLVVILTRPSGYRTPPSPKAESRLWRRIYSRYPAFCRRLEQEEKIFNQQFEELERLQREGKAFLLCPTGRAKVGRLERDPQRLEALYLEGRKAMLDNLPALREFLAK